MRSMLAVTTASALIGFALYPLMPPRLLSNCASQYGACEPGHNYVDTLVDPGGLWSFESRTMEAISNQYAAMPSLHVAWAVWCTIGLYPRAEAAIHTSCHSRLSAVDAFFYRGHRQPLLDRRHRRACVCRSGLALSPETLTVLARWRSPRSFHKCHLKWLRFLTSTAATGHSCASMPSTAQLICRAAASLNSTIFASKSARRSSQW